MKTLVCFGDSNTYGASPMDAAGQSFRYGHGVRWPSRLAALLGPEWHVVEEGLPGRTTCHDNPFDGPHKNGLRALPMVLESHFPMEMIAVMLGTNDLKGYLGQSPLDLAKGLRRILFEISRSSAGPNGGAPEMLVIAPVPVDECGPTAEALPGAAEKSRRATGLYRDLAEEFGARFFDAGSVASASPIDGVHLTEAAHAAIAQGVAKVIC